MNVFETPGIGQSLETSAESIRQSLTLLKPEKPPKPPEYPKTYPDDSFEKFKRIMLYALTGLISAIALLLIIRAVVRMF